MGFIKDYYSLMDLERELLEYIIDSLASRCRSEIVSLGITLPEITGEIPYITFEKAREILRKEFNKSSSGTNINPEEESLLSKWAEEELKSEWLFITKYPSTKRPFYTMPDKNNSKHTSSFDLLFRGIEVTTGGQRIHDYEMLKENMRQFNLTPDNYTHYLDIFKYGMPPHGGLAIGLERLTMKLCNLTNIKEASLFPRDRKKLHP
jgi:nondiscriminating aspartyl-tRNA synthetase